MAQLSAKPVCLSACKSRYSPKQCGVAFSFFRLVHNIHPRDDLNSQWEDSIESVWVLLHHHCEILYQTFRSSVIIVSTWLCWDHFHFHRSSNCHPVSQDVLKICIYWSHSMHSIVTYSEYFNYFTIKTLTVIRLYTRGENQASLKQAQ